MEKIKVRMSNGEVRDIVISEVKTVGDLREVVEEMDSSATRGGLTVSDDTTLNNGDTIMFSPKTGKQNS